MFIRDIIEILSFTLGPWEIFWIVFFTSATYANAGFMREQVCKYMCPYARFQSAMFDADTLTIAYDGPRGEPRGSPGQPGARGWPACGGLVPPLTRAGKNPCRAARPAPPGGLPLDPVRRRQRHREPGGG